MIVVDSSVWIDFLRGTETPAVRALRVLGWREQLLMLDIILLELLRGARDESHAARMEAE